jgi:hypothetical protein
MLRVQKETNKLHLQNELAKQNNKVVVQAIQIIKNKPFVSIKKI